MNSPPKLLVIGGYSAGKTHFGAQLLSRLQSRTCTFQLREASPSLVLLEEALVRLSEGMTTSHTSRELFGTILLPIVDTVGRQVDVVWPEFGGEQVDDFVATRRMSSEWIGRIEEANSWILMLRLMQLRTDEDLVNKAYDSAVDQPADKTQPLERSDAIGHGAWSAQARLLELMQMLLYFKEASLRSRVSIPRLTVLLSCWDELAKPEGTVPSSVLQEYLPLFADFLTANWMPNEFAIYGLSADQKLNLDRHSGRSRQDQRTERPSLPFHHEMHRDRGTFVPRCSWVRC